MNRRHFLLNMQTAAVAGCTINLFHGAAAQELRPVLPTPPRIRIAQGEETPVVLQALNIDVEVSGSRALTTVEMTFFNPNRRVLEGELQFPLMDGQQIVGFALDIDGKLRDAVPVDKATGQQVFEDVIRARIDPALLEVTQGNNYKLRVYPLPAQGTRRVLLRYAETLTVDGALRRYRLPLEYAKQLANFQLRVTVRAPEAAPKIGGTGPQGLNFQAKGIDYEAEISRRDFAARGLLEVFLPASTKPEVRTQVVNGKTYFLAEMPVPMTAALFTRIVPNIVGIVWDASGSGAQRDRVREFALLDAYFKHMGSGEVRLTRVREVAEPAETFRISNGDWSALKRALEATPFDGATQLGAVNLNGGAGEILVFSDGLDNFGDTRLARAKVPVYAINTAAKTDHARLRAMAELSGGRYIDMTAVSAADAARQLLQAAPRITDLQGEGVAALTTASRLADAANGYRWLVAGELTGASGVVTVTYDNPQARALRLTQRIMIKAGDNADTQAARAWAGLRVAELDGEYRMNRVEIRRLGMAFGLPSRETSLIVLDRVEDYVRHEITPPAELRAEYERQRANLHVRAGDDRKRQSDRVVQMLKEKTSWWERDFPKGEPPRREVKAKQASGRADGMLMQERGESDLRRQAPATESSAMRDRVAAPPPPSSRPAAPAPALAGRSQDAMASMGAGTAAKDESRPVSGAASIGIQLKRWTPDAPYYKRFSSAGKDELYRIYLEERAAYTNSTAFFLDAADAFFEKGLTALGVRVLSNLAEMDLENRHILRILGYRLMQANQPKLAIPILQRVLELAPNEPQSYRDLGLAFAADKQWQKATDNLNEVVIRPWHGRFPEIELTALDELNAIVAIADSAVNTSRYDTRLLRNLPVDLRVAMSWDADNTDIDLWVTDPNGEKAYYGNRITWQGGRMSQDYTGGYGPETFSLKHAKPGKYKVEANFYGHNQQIVASATTLQLKLTTKFGTREAKEQVVTLRLKGRSEMVQVGEFEVK